MLFTRCKARVRTIKTCSRNARPRHVRPATAGTGKPIRGVRHRRLSIHAVQTARKYSQCDSGTYNPLQSTDQDLRNLRGQTKLIALLYSFGGTGNKVIIKLSAFSPTCQTLRPQLGTIYSFKGHHNWVIVRIIGSP